MLFILIAIRIWAQAILMLAIKGRMSNKIRNNQIQIKSDSINLTNSL